jgi:hypothetical protein
MASNPADPERFAEPDRSTRIGLLGTWIFLGVVVAFGVYTLLVLGKVGPFSQDSQRGIFGDAYGALTSLFNALAFAGLLIAVLLQREDLKMQVDELRETRQVLGEQRQQLEHQADAARKQVFESTFFQLVTSIRNMVDSRKYAEGIVGTSAMHEWAIKLRDREGQKLREDSQTPITAYKLFEQWFGDSRHILGPYFELVVVTLEFVERSDRPDKIFYIDVLRATLSPGEQFLLFHFGLYNLEKPDFKRLAEKYGLFEDIRLDAYDLDRARQNWYSARSALRQPLPK